MTSLIQRFTPNSVHIEIVKSQAMTVARVATDWVGRNVISIAAVATAGLSLAAFVYYRLHRNDALPFDSWNVSVFGYPFRTQMRSKDDILKNEDELLRHSPRELLQRLYSDSVARNQFRPDEKEFLKKETASITPPYKETSLLFAEDESALVIQKWATMAQQWLGFIESQISWRESIQSIQSSPRLFYTFLFNLSLAYGAGTIYEGIKEYLPESLLNVGDFFLQHKGKIALAAFTVVTFLYLKMKREKGILTNLSENWATLHRVHRNLDLVPSYRSGVHEVLSYLGKLAPGQHGSSILWHFNKGAHSTFEMEIGNILAEMSATGRIYDSQREPKEYPHLKNLQIFELDLNAFLVEYRGKGIHQGWIETMKHITKGNVLVVLKSLSVIEQFLFAEVQQNPGEGFQGGRRPQDGDCEKTLYENLLHSLRQGQFRCIIEIDENEKKRLEAKPDTFKLFSSVKAPDITPDELETLCKQLFCCSGNGYSLPTGDVENLFSLMKDELKNGPFSPSYIMNAIQDTLRTREIKRQKEGISPNLVRARHCLAEAGEIKEKLLQKLWKQRQASQESLPILRSLLLLEKVVIPAYGAIYEKSQISDAASQQELLKVVEKRFNVFYGPSTPDENAKLKQLSLQLGKEIIGQDPSLRAICEGVRKWRSVPNGKPLVLFMAGPSGVGKTETLTKLALELNSIYGISETAMRTRERNIHRVALNHPPDGIFGWGKIKADVLSFILENPTSVIVFDEWDKLKEERDKLCFLDLMDGTNQYFTPPWTVQGQNGQFVDTRCSIIVFISNFASDKLLKPWSSDPEAQAKELEADVKMVETEILKSFQNEAGGRAFLSRIKSRVIPYRGLSQDDSLKIAVKHLDENIQRKVLPQEKKDIALKLIQGKLAVGQVDARNLQDIVRDVIDQVKNA